MKNQIFITLDSLRWDVFSQLPPKSFLRRLGKWCKAFTQGTYTFPAHLSFFVGKLPQAFNRLNFVDTAATRIGKSRGTQLWEVSNPETKRSSLYKLDGTTIISGFANCGYVTLGTGAVNWFNPKTPGGEFLTQFFQKFKFFGSLEYAEQQVDWAIKETQHLAHPFFLFINFGETHHPFVHRGCCANRSHNPYGNRRECLERQLASLKFLDVQIQRLLTTLKNFDLVICSDHGEVLGENGLWGHGFYHPKVMQIPLLVKVSK